MTKAGLEIRILGCGSSGGVPRIGNDWGVCDPSEPRNRRTRCSILLRWREHERSEPTLVLIDTSPDIREQLLAARVTRLDAVAITHDHADQCHGLDDLRSLVIRSRKRMPVYMGKETSERLMTRFGYCFENNPGYPAILDARVMIEDGVPLRLSGQGGDLGILPLDLDHGTMRSFGFRIGDFAYCNDVVRIPDRALERLQGLDILVVDALRYAPHPTHANVAEALGWIEHLKPKRAILTNMHVDLDYQTLLRELPPGVEPAFDGMELACSGRWPAA
jgi:phosphoribosyl 1,2-cyclic phosphate phosphodiesterase